MLILTQNKPIQAMCNIMADLYCYGYDCVWADDGLMIVSRYIGVDYAQIDRIIAHNQAIHPYFDADYMPNTPRECVVMVYGL